MVRGSTIDMTKMPKNNCDVDLLIHNKFEIEVTNAETGEVKRKAEAYNIIKKDFWDYLFGSNEHRAWFQAIVFGNGSGTPSADTSGLFSYVGGKSASGNTFKTVPEEGYAYHRRSIQLGVSEFVGSTITEVGISATGANQANRVFTHAMLQDMNGNQISITKTDTDIITIYATVYVHWNPAGYEDGKIKISFSGEANPRDGQLISELLGYLYQSSDVHRYAYFYSGPPNASSIASSGGSLVKDLSTKTYKLTFGRLGVSTGNVTSGILSAYAMNVCLQAPCSGLPGTNIVAEAIATGNGSTTEFNTKFPFPQSAEIFVDGVLCTDVVVDGDNPGTKLPYTTAFEFLPEYSTLSRKGFGIQMGIFDGQATGTYGSGGGYTTYLNKWAHLGVTQIVRSYTMTLQLSNDLVNWYELKNIASNNSNYKADVPEEYRYAKYWRFINPYTSGISGYAYYSSVCPSVTTVSPKTNNIRFTTPPAEGSVITANYFTPAVAKDSNHVFDMSITIHLGEYTE